MKKLFLLLGLALMATMCVTLSSCGDDDDDITNTTDGSLTGVHKIKITVTGNPGTFEWSAGFKGMTWHDNRAEMAVLHDDKGNVIDKTVENFSSITVETNQYGTALAAAMIVSDYNDKNTGEITIKLEGYVNGKLRNSKTYEIKAGEQRNLSIGFSSEAID